MPQRRERRRVAVELARQLEMPLFYRVGHEFLITKGQKRREHLTTRAATVLSSVPNGRLGRFRTADLLCVREALSH